MMGSLQRVEQENVTSQSLANAIENMNRTRTDATGDRLRLKDEERLYLESWSGSTSLAVSAREIAAWLGYVDPKHEPGKLIQQITKGTLRATEAWTDGRHAENDKYVGLDHELAVALATVPRHDKWHGKRWLMPKSSNDPAFALQPLLATPKRCNDAKELKEKLTDGH